QLTRRFEAADAEYLNNVERFESRLARIEADSGEAIIDRRLQNIEQALADMARLIEKNAPEKPATSEAPVQFEKADPKPAATEPHDLPPHVPPFAAATGMPILDLPPFPEKPKSSFASLSEPAAPPPEADLRAAPDTVFGDSAKQPMPAGEESYLAAARRSARNENSPQPRSASFSWVDLSGQKQAETTHTRLILIGGLGLLIFAAIGMGFYFSSTEGPSAAHTTAAPAHYAAVAKARQPYRLQTPPHVAQLAAAPAAAPKAVGVAATPNTAPTQTTPESQSLATTVQNRPVPSTSSLHKSPVPALAKALTPEQRLAALANAGHAKAEEVLGLAYLDGDGVAVNEAEGAKWLQRAAARGEAVAAWRLGTLYERGHGVAADPVKAAQWYAVAAKAGNRKAMHNLAVAYAQGAGVRKDLALAAQWFTRAANLGLADSQFNLAVLYERGLGVPQSLEQAYKWYAIAADRGDAGSRTRMEAIATQLNANDKAAADKSAASFQPSPLDGAANAPPVAASLVGGA
ncbi:MAG TPA: tetratricopeptide repeat protein, partial [Rhizomicrobium sp.]|nr:tetratricopeptide repeat protein [Rhizomicrobium sp.]